LAGGALGAGGVPCEKIKFVPDSRQSITAPQVILAIFIILSFHAPEASLSNGKNGLPQFRNDNWRGFDSRIISNQSVVANKKSLTKDQRWLVRNTAE
jgi:hypothetical protein